MSRGLGDVYKRQMYDMVIMMLIAFDLRQNVYRHSCCVLFQTENDTVVSILMQALNVDFLSPDFPPQTLTLFQHVSCTLIYIHTSLKKTTKTQIFNQSRPHFCHIIVAAHHGNLCWGSCSGECVSILNAFHPPCLDAETLPCLALVE